MDAIPGEGGKLLGQRLDIDLRVAENERVDDRVEHPHLQMRHEIRRRRTIYQAERLHAPEADGEVAAGQLAQAGQARFEPWIDGGRLLQNDGRRIAVGGKKEEPAQKTALEHSAAVVFREPHRRVWLIEHSFDTVVKVVDDRQEDLFLAVEVEIERPTRDAGVGDDVADGGCAIAFACEDGDGRVEKLLTASRRSRSGCGGEDGQGVQV